MIRWNTRSLWLGMAALTVGLAACGREEARSPAPPAQDKGPIAEAPRSGGTIEAEARYYGPPVIETVRINKDVGQCGEEKRVGKIVVGDENGLLDAFVSVTEAKGAKPAEATPKPALDQKGCEFRPPVLGMMPGEIEILNSDGILHNIHTFSVANPPINKAQPKFKKVMTERLDEPEIIRVQCDVHSWMEGWIVVTPHPYFGVTGERGKTRIENVPVGKQTIEAWHPVLGRQTKEVEVKPGETTRVTFEFKRGK